MRQGQAGSEGVQRAEDRLQVGDQATRTVRQVWATYNPACWKGETRRLESCKGTGNSWSVCFLGTREETQPTSRASVPVHCSVLEWTGKRKRSCVISSFFLF